MIILESRIHGSNIASGWIINCFNLIQMPVRDRNCNLSAQVNVKVKAIMWNKLLLHCIAGSSAVILLYLNLIHSTLKEKTESLIHAIQVDALLTANIRFLCVSWVFLGPESNCMWSHLQCLLLLFIFLQFFLIVTGSVKIANSKVVALEGTTFKVHCNISGFHSQHVSWINASNYMVETGSILKFPNISRHHQGEYNCSASNVCGDDSSRVYIDVRCELMLMIQY